MLPCSVPARVDLAGLFDDGERARVARSVVGVLLFSLSFGGVLFCGLAQPLSLELSFFLGLASPLTRTPGDERGEDDGDGVDAFMGLRLSLSFNFEGVFFLGLDLDDDCAVRWPLSGLLAVGVLPPGVEEAVEFDREGGGVRAAHLSGPVLCRGRHGDCSLRDADLVAATVFGLTRSSSCALFFIGVRFDDATRRTRCIPGGRRLASSWAFSFERARLGLAAVGLTSPGAPSTSGCTLLGVVGVSLRMGCASPRSERPS